MSLGWSARLLLSVFDVSVLFTFIWASLIVQLVKNLPAMWETWIRSLDWEDSPGEGKATHSSILGPVF